MLTMKFKLSSCGPDRLTQEQLPRPGVVSTQ